MTIIKSIFLILLITVKSSFAGDFDNLKVIGKTPLSFLGFKLYDIELRGESSEFFYDQKLAIRIIYNKNFSKEELINTSIDEICRINSLKKEDIEMIYRKNFAKLFVDVKKGDTKIAIFNPKFGLEFYYNDQLTGKINDVVFARRFIDIWLSDKARFKKVRDILIGVK
jgi:hypothetical protein